LQERRGSRCTLRYVYQCLAETVADPQTFFGTKKLVEAHIDEVVASIDYVRTATNVSLEEKRVFFRGINKNYGSSALCLSGGASFGYYQYAQPQ
jgi:hypothetical protein